MFVHLSVRRCNCCYKSIEASIVDLPIEEIKLTKFPIPCDCGYFMVGEHYPVSYDKWKIHNACIQSQINFIENDICPNCNNTLVTRKNKNGDKFIGCSNYPQCKFTHS